MVIVWVRPSSVTGIGVVMLLSTRPLLLSTNWAYTAGGAETGVGETDLRGADDLIARRWGDRGLHRIARRAGVDDREGRSLIGYGPEPPKIGQIPRNPPLAVGAV